MTKYNPDKWYFKPLLKRLNERSLLKEKYVNEDGDWKYIPATDKTPAMYKCQQRKYWRYDNNGVYEVDSNGNPKGSSKDDDNEENSEPKDDEGELKIDKNSKLYKELEQLAKENKISPEKFDKLIKGELPQTISEVWH